MDILSVVRGNWLAVEALPETAPIAALAIQDLPAGGRLLTVASEAGGGLVGFRLEAEGTARFVNMQSYVSDASALSGVTLETLDLGGRSHLIPLGAAAGGLTGFAIGADGRLEAPRDLDPHNIFPDGTVQAAALFGDAMLATASGATLTIHDLDGGAQRTEQVQLAPGEGPFTALATVGDEVLLGTLAGHHALRSYTLSASGTLKAVDEVGAADGAGLNTPSALAVSTVEGQAYAVMAAAGSDTLTVFSVSADGSLTATDHMLDSRDTRFEGARQIEALVYEDWSLLLAAGRDGGASLFALLPGGRLFHLHSLSWDSPPGRTAEARGLAALAVDITGSTLELHAAPEGERGLHQAALDLSGLGIVVKGGGALTGSAGVDILIAGGIGTRMTGGAGADHFVFLPQQADSLKHLGTVLDFTPGEDWIDLSALPFFTQAQQAVLRIEGGATIVSAGGYTLTLQGLTATGLAAVDLIAPPQAHHSVDYFVVTDPVVVPPPPPPPAPMPEPDRKGGNGDDRISGSGDSEWIVGLGGRDILTGGGGDDTIDGGSGDDTIDGGSGTDTAVFAVRSSEVTVTYGDGVFTLTSSTGADQVTGVERFRFTDTTLTAAELEAKAGKGSGGGASGGVTRLGTPDADELRGGGQDDVLVGNAGNDRLLGYEGNDTLDGGDGSDTLNGGDGDDRIIGGGSSADLRDIIYAGAGHDNVDAGHGNDLVYGQAGNDTIAGGF
ncbi:hypothetical protein KBY26_21125, partial [Ruegeria pomeroyi]|nr:hypothetical protein [Ruegeria pomeroyi]